MTAEELGKLRQTEPDAADGGVSAGVRAEKTDRFQAPERTGNLCLFFHGETVVRLRFAEGGRSLEDRLRDYFIGLKQG